MVTETKYLQNKIERSRMKKYDSYLHSPNRSVRKLPHQHTVSDIAVISDNSKYKTAPSKVLMDEVKPVQKFSHTPKQTNPKQSYQSLRNKSTSMPLQAVAQSKASIEDVYNDLNDPLVAGNISKKLNRFQKALYGFGVFVIVFSLFVSVQTFITNLEAKRQVAAVGALTADEQGVSQGTGSEPSEAEVSKDAIANYRVANPEDPRYLRIPELNVFARVKGLGVDSQGAVDAPWNINDVGWFKESVRPGNAVGSSLLMGHVSGWTAPGVFKKLEQLKTGSLFEVEKGSGEIIKYEVTRTELLSLDQVDMGQVLSTEVRGQHDLKLMTCSGRYNRDTETYEDRFIVYARQIK